MCGFVGVTGVDHAAPIVWLALQTLQHRGQDAAGIGTTEGARIHLHKDLGMVVHAVPVERGGLFCLLSRCVCSAHVAATGLLGKEPNELCPSFSR